LGQGDRQQPAGIQRWLGVDELGNVYATGRFEQTVCFEPSLLTSSLTAHGGADVFVSKFSDSGSLLWARSFGSTSSEAGGSLAVDDAGNMLVTGGLRGSAHFDLGDGETTLTSNGRSDVFVNKFDTDGELVSARSFGGTASDGGGAVAFDDAGDAYVVGYFEQSIDLAPMEPSLDLTSNGLRDVFVAKLRHSG
jgi:hypothetical protein